MKTTNLKPEEVETRWYVYDASEHALGRMATKIAMQLMGKDRPTYTPNMLNGAHVVVLNAGAAEKPHWPRDAPQPQGLPRKRTPSQSTGA